MNPTLGDPAGNDGKLFLLVGNSGSGKDTLIRFVTAGWPPDFPPLYTPRRYITRPPHPSEPFISISRDDFTRMRLGGGFFLDWVSYGVNYGLPADMADYLNRGATVLVNVSREVVGAARERYPGARVVFIEVPYGTTAMRLLRRGRENPSDDRFQERLQRARRNQTFTAADFILPNNGDLETSVAGLTAYMRSQFEDAGAQP